MNNANADALADDVLGQLVTMHQRGVKRLSWWQQMKAKARGWLQGRATAATLQAAAESIAVAYSTAIDRIAALEAELARKEHEAQALRHDLDRRDSELKISQMEVTLLAEVNNRNVERIQAERAVVHAAMNRGNDETTKIS